jgi:phosphatidylglycerophosphate synthase
MLRASSRGPFAGLAVLAVLLATLSGTVGIGLAGWLAGSTYGLVLTIVLRAGLDRAGMRKLGPANVVTLTRALLVGGVTALVANSIDHPVPTAVLVALVAVALSLDGVDGQVARRTGSTSALGARFDMEIGAFRYVFVAASWACPWLTAALPPKFSRKVVAAVQGVVLVVATAGLLPHAVTFVAVAAALASLTWSFGRDIGWLWQTESAQRTYAIIPVSPAPALPALEIVPLAATPRRPSVEAVELRRFRRQRASVSV